MISSAVFLLTLLSVVTLHESVLKRVEVDHLPLPIIGISGITYCIITYATNLSNATAIVVVFWTSLWLYIGAYRAFFHPLRNYPGPFAARISKFWAVKQVLNTERHWHLVQQQLQKEYGDYVRTGPRELSIFDPAAIQPILGFKSKTTKSPYYDILDTSLNMQRDKSWHRQRRKIWDNAMKSSLTGYAPRIEEFTDQLLTRLKAEQGKHVPLLEAMSHFSYDVSTDLAFGQAMGLTKGTSSVAADRILGIFTQGMKAFGVMYHVPWLTKALDTIAFVGPMKDWADWSAAQMEARLKLVDAPTDVMAHLIRGTPDNLAGRKLLHSEARLIITAGSETTATTLTFVFIQLALHPDYLRAIREEFRNNLADYHCERPRPILDAVVAETMRLWPPVFFASPRVTPPEGLTINDCFIPGNTIVQIPPFVLNRDPRNFAHPDEFIPERWTTKPELVLDRNAFFPFMTGPNSCAGKGLAHMEMRSVIGRVVNEYDVRMPESFEVEEYWERIEDHFTAAAPGQEVEFVSVGTL